MKEVQIANDILPVGEFKSSLASVLDRLRECGRPIVITQNGRPAAVLLPPEDFDRLLETERFLASVREGLADVQSGRLLSDDELEREITKAFGARKKG